MLEGLQAEELLKVTLRESPAQLLDTSPKDQNLDPEDVASLSRGFPKWSRLVSSSAP